MSSARLILRRSLTSLFAPYLLIGSICLLVVLVVFHPRARAVEGTLNVTATTASYSGTMTQAGNQPIRTAFGPLRLDYKSGPNAWTTGFLMREGDGNISIGANITSADFYSTSKLRVLGIVESTNGGFKFPDGTTQTSAASAAVGGGWTDGGTNIYNTTLTDNVGIGTTGPQYKLDVGPVGGAQSATTGSLGLIRNSAPADSSPYTQARLIIYGGTGVDTGNWGYLGYGADAIMRIVYSKTSSANHLAFGTSSAMDGTGTFSENMRITGGGNVGIGSTIPGAKLEVAGNINSSTGALQTAGVTRIANDGVGTFAAGTTIGGSTITTAVVDKTLASGRLTLTSGTPVTTADVTAATTVYYTPYDGDVISLYDGTSTWTTLTFSELSLALTSYTANTNYDIWAYNNSGTVALESTAWTNDTTRATALVYQNGVLVKTGATTRRYLGTIRITGTTGQTEDSTSKRFVWNLKNRVKKTLKARVSGQDNYWTYNSTTWRAENTNTTDGVGRFSLVIGYPYEEFSATFLGEVDQNASGNPVGIGIGIDSTTVNSAQLNNGAMTVNQRDSLTALYRGFLSAGYHYIQKLEVSYSLVTFWSDVWHFELGMIGETGF